MRQVKKVSQTIRSLSTIGKGPLALLVMVVALVSITGVALADGTTTTSDNPAGAGTAGTTTSTDTSTTSTDTSTTSTDTSTTSTDTSTTSTDTSTTSTDTSTTSTGSTGGTSTASTGTPSSAVGGQSSGGGGNAGASAGDSGNSPVAAESGTAKGGLPFTGLYAPGLALIAVAMTVAGIALRKRLEGSA